MLSRSARQVSKIVRSRRSRMSLESLSSLDTRSFDFLARTQMNRSSNVQGRIDVVNTLKQLIHQIPYQNPIWSIVGEHMIMSLDSQMFSSQNIVSQKEQILKVNDAWGYSRHGFDDISHEFHITMMNALRRTNLDSMGTKFFFKQTSGSYGGYRESEPSSFGGNIAIQNRHFSTNPPSPAGNDDEKNALSNVTSKSPSPNDKTTSPATAKTLTKTDSSFDKAQDMLSSAISTLVSFLMKIPGLTWFYITHPKEFKEKLSELKEAAKKEAHHYYMGTKLLIADLRTARQMLGRTLQGSSLTRRERKQLLRTVTDVFRLVPMSIFVLIPFMEFALPFALKLFPNMLPSTFQDSLKAEENMKRELKSRLAMAEFFQETLHGLAKEQKKRAELKKQKLVDADGCSSDLESTENREETAASFLEFIEKARNGEFLPPEVVIRYAKYFQDEMTLDNMHRMQLINMCKYMALPPYGNDNLLRFQLRHKIRTLLEDDQRILWEGINSLTKMELREACQERGMRSTGLSKESYKRALQQWIDLSVNRNVPISLLIMSRTFFLQEEITRTTKRADGDTSKSVTGLADAISGFDKEVVNEVILESVTKDQNDPELTKLKLEVLEQQNELIQEENQQREAEAAKLEAMKAEKEKSESVKPEEDDKVTGGTSPIATGSQDTSVAPDVVELKIIIPEEEFSSEGNEGKPKSKVIDQFDGTTDTKEEVEEEEDASLSSEEIDAISQLVSPDPVSAEREKLASIKAALQGDDVAEVDENKESNAADDELSIEEFSKDYEKSDSQFESIPSEFTDKIAEDQIDTLDKEAQTSFDTSSRVSFDGEINESEKIDEMPSGEQTEDDTREDRLDVAVTRLKSKVESMVGKIEIKMSDIEAKIGDKMHMLDKDKDGILSQEEMALTLQSVLKRPLTFDEAMAIAADMDENEDGLFTLEELSKWLETNKIVKLVEEGRDAEVDKIVAAKRAKMKENKEKDVETK